MSLFFKKPQTLTTLKSLLINKLYTVCSDNNFHLYKNITIYDNNKKFIIPLIIIDKNRGIYIFEKKDWSYDELKNDKAQKLKNKLLNRLLFEKIHNIVTFKLERNFTTKDIPIFKFLLMENLNIGQYNYLDNSFYNILPKEIIMFNDMSEKDILDKFKEISTPLEKEIDIDKVITTIFPQYSIIDNNEKAYLCSKEQMKLIDEKIKGHTTLNAEVGSGRTSILLLKAITEVLEDSKNSVVIIKPTKISCERLDSKLQNILEENNFAIQPKSIEILTPLEVVNRHLQKYNKELLLSNLKIDNFLMNKKFHLADQIFCDDVDFIESSFIYYLIHIQKEKPLLFVSNHNYEKVYSFQKSFRLQQQKMHFFLSEPHKKMITVVSDILKSNLSEEILIVTNNIISVEILRHQLKSEFEERVENILLSTYSDIYGLNAKFILLMNSCIAPFRELAYSFYLAEVETYILEESECEQINSLRNSFESNKN